MAKQFAGARIKRLRAKLGLSQVEMARRVNLSVSYVNQLENDQRPLTVTVLLKLTDTFDVEAGFFSGDSEARMIADLRSALADASALSGTGVFDDAVPVEIVARFPEVATHLIALTRRLTEVEARDNGTPLDGQMAYERVRDFFYARRNHIPELDAQAEILASRFTAVGADAEPEARTWLSDELGVRVEIVGHQTPWGDGRAGFSEIPRRRYDRERKVLELPGTASPGRRYFQIGVQIAFLRHSDLIDRIVASEPGMDEQTRALARVGLAQYFAGALLLPYERFLAVARQERYDVELLAQQFGVGFETICHRLSTLQRTGSRGVPFLFLRTDRAGNISKRQSATAFHFSRAGGSCPLWVVHRAFESPNRVVRQVAEMPDGRRYLWIAKSVAGRTRGFGAPTPEFSVALGCAVEDSDALVYADGLNLSSDARATPIGAGCRVCDRSDCVQRAFPQSGAVIEAPENSQGASPYATFVAGGRRLLA